MMLPPKPKAAPIAQPPKAAAAPRISSNDLLEPGVDINTATYFLHGWCTPQGDVLPDHTSLNAAGLARAWARLGLLVDTPLDGIVRIEELVGSSFNEKTTKWLDGLPAELRFVLIERTAEADEPEEVARWFEAIAPTLIRWADVRALVQHLSAVASYMRVESNVRAASTPEQRSISVDDALPHFLVIEDPVRTVLQGPNKR